MKIYKIRARQILDSRGHPTVEAEVFCRGGWGRVAVPSGASTGEHEAHELRDNEAAFSGKGVLKAVNNIENEIAKYLIDISADDQYKIDEIMIELDGSPNKSRLGANAILAVSLAAAHAAAFARQLPLFRHLNDVAHNPEMSLPMPMLNILNGGQHATNSSDFQEYMVVPTMAKSYRGAVQISEAVFTELKAVLAEKGMPTTVGDEGGFAPSVQSNTEMLDLLDQAGFASGHRPGEAISFALDVAASEFFKNGKYNLKTENRNLSSNEMIQYLYEVANKYPIVSIEDGLAEDEWGAWTQLTSELHDLQLVGDDLLVTNRDRLKKAIDTKAANAILIKPNQIGTLTETIKTIALAKEHNWNTIVSHRSGETEDTTISHLAVGTGAGQIKTGSVSRGERTAKHNELIRIEDTNPELKMYNPYT